MKPVAVMPVVRRAEPSDAANLADIRIASWRAAYSGLVAQEVLDGLDVTAETKRFAERMHAVAERHTLVAELGPAKVVGYCIYGPDRDEPRPDLGEIYAIYVHPEHAGRGAGGALLDRAVEDLTAAGRTTAVLWVLTENHRARAFYARKGWTPDGASRKLERLRNPQGCAVDEVRYVGSARLSR